MNASARPPVARRFDGRSERGTAVTFEEFLDAELTGLRRYATVLTGDPQSAHDVLAEALLQAHTGWSRIGRMEFPLAYVRRMVTTRFVSDQRRWSVRHIRLTRSGRLPEASAPSPTDAVDDRAELHELLAALPRRQRAAVVLRYYLGLDTDAVATELGITPGAARTAISRGLAAMRMAVDERSVLDAPGGDGPSVAGRPSTDDVTSGRPRAQEGS